MEYTELTDKCSRLHGPPRATGFFRIPVLILAWFWGAPPVHCILTQPVNDKERGQGWQRVRDGAELLGTQPLPAVISRY